MFFSPRNFVIDLVSEDDYLGGWRLHKPYWATARNIGLVCVTQYPMSRGFRFRQPLAGFVFFSAGD